MAEWCAMCGAPLKPDAEVWLELDMVTNQYYLPSEFPPDGESQGHFAVGPQCAKVIVGRRIGKAERKRLKAAVCAPDDGCHIVKGSGYSYCQQMQLKIKMKS